MFQGNAIPQPPEVPAQIARALAYIAKYTPQEVGARTLAATVLGK